MVAGVTSGAAIWSLERPWTLLGARPADTNDLYGPQNLRFALPPPVERQLNEAFAQRWQKELGSVVPASGAAAMSDASQPRKQYICPDDSKDAQTSLKPARHSPGTAQQLASDWHVCVQ
jgi:hypothetical protein